MLDDLDTKNYEHLVAKVIEEVQWGIHLEGYDRVCASNMQ